jgi:uridylate kinase
VDGVYTGDPKKDQNHDKFEHITYDEVISRELKVLDMTAVSLSKENNLHIKVFNITKKGNIVKAITDKNIGTSITKGGKP